MEKNNKVASLSDDLKPSDEALVSSLDEEVPKKKSFLGKLTKSGWFWAGVGAVVIGAAVVLSSSNQTTTVPSHTVQ